MCRRGIQGWLLLGCKREGIRRVLLRQAASAWVNFSCPMGVPALSTNIAAAPLLPICSRED